MAAIGSGLGLRAPGRWTGANSSTGSPTPFSSCAPTDSTAIASPIASAVAAVISTSWSSSRVIASTRAATLTASPMTLKLSRPAPPIAPATTRPVLTPTPTRSSPASPRSFTRRQISIAARVARVAWSGYGSGAPKTASRPSPSNLSTWPPWRATIGTTTSNRPLSAATTSFASAPAAKLVKSLTSQNRIETSSSMPSSSKRVGEDVLGDLAVEVGAERLADLLALGQALDHLVERGRQLADLVAGRDRDRDREVAAP